MPGMVAFCVCAAFGASGYACMVRGVNKQAFRVLLFLSQLNNSAHSSGRSDLCHRHETWHSLGLPRHILSPNCLRAPVSGSFACNLHRIRYTGIQGVARDCCAVSMLYGDERGVQHLHACMSGLKGRSILHWCSVRQMASRVYMLSHPPASCPHLAPLQGAVRDLPRPGAWPRAAHRARPHGHWRRHTPAVEDLRHDECVGYQEVLYVRHGQASSR